MQFALEIDHLTKDFFENEKKSRALDDISLNIEEGKIFGIIGQSGAGKSTLLKCMSTLEPVFSGKILFQGTPIDFQNKQSIKHARKQIGMIFQHFLLLESKTVLQNILLPLDFAKETPQKKEATAKELLTLVGLERKKDCYPASLSGGEKQRVAIARALATDPQILFCDEATSALDPKTTQEILELLKKLNQTKGLTIVLITHEMDVVRRICHQVAVLDQGKLIESGDVLEVFSNPKNKLTQELVQSSSHEMDLSYLKSLDSESLLLRLHFKGEFAEQPILSKLISELHIEVNILSGWIDTIQGTSIGCLTLTLKGTSIQKEKAFEFLKYNHISCEVLS